jgi:hypothetical protein
MYAQLTGDQSFQAACANYYVGSPMAPTAFGSGPTLTYTASTDTYAVTADGYPTSFGPADIDPSAPGGVKAYARAEPGSSNVQRLVFPLAVVAGTNLDYARTFTFDPPATAQKNYTCIFGVPTLVSDLPAATTVAYSKVGLLGKAYRSNFTASVINTYALESSVVTVSINTASGTVNVSMHLLGTLLSSSDGLGAANADFGVFTGTGTYNAATGTFSGQFTDSTGKSFFSPFSGCLFGPQGKEAAFAYSFGHPEPSDTGSLVSIGTVAAIR